MAAARRLLGADGPSGAGSEGVPLRQHECRRGGRFKPLIESCVRQRTHRAETGPSAGLRRRGPLGPADPEPTRPARAPTGNAQTSTVTNTQIVSDCPARNIQTNAILLFDPPRGYSSASTAIPKAAARRHRQGRAFLRTRNTLPIRQPAPLRWRARRQARCVETVASSLSR